MNTFTSKQLILTSASLLLVLHLKLETRGEPMGELQVTSPILLCLQLTYDLMSDPVVSHGRLNQPQTGFSEGTPQLGTPVLKPDLRERDGKITGHLVQHTLM